MLIFLASTACFSPPEPLAAREGSLDMELKVEFQLHKRAEDTTMFGWDDPQQEHDLACTLDRVEMTSDSDAIVTGAWHDDFYSNEEYEGHDDVRFRLMLHREDSVWVCDDATSTRDTAEFLSGCGHPCQDFARVCLGSATHPGWRENSRPRGSPCGG